MLSPMIGFMGGKKALVSSNMLMYAIFAEQPQFYRMDTTPWSAVDPLPSPSQVTGGFCCAYSSTANMMAIGGGGPGEIEVYDTTTYPFTSLFADGLLNSVRGVDFSPDGTLMATGEDNNFPNTVYDTSDFSNTWQTVSGSCSDVSFNHDNTILALAITVPLGGPYLRLYDVTTFPGTTMSNPSPQPPTSCYSVACHPTQNVLVVGSSTTLFLYDLDTLTQIGSIGLGQVTALAWNNAGDRLAVGTVPAGVKLRVYDTSDLLVMANWTLVGVNDVPTVSYVQATAYSSDDVYLASEATDEIPNLRAWDTSTDPMNLVSNFDPGQTSTQGAQDAVFLDNISLPFYDFLADNNPDLLLFYKFDTNTGNVAVDSSIQNADGTTTGIVLDPGYIGAGSFSFINNPLPVAIAPVVAYVTTPAPLTLTTDWAISIWYLYGDKDRNSILGSVGVNSSWIELKEKFGNISISVLLDGELMTDTNTAIPATDTNWHHLAISKTANLVEIYSDGVLLNTPIIKIESFILENIGTYATTDTGISSRCTLDQLRVFNRGITASEVAQLYNET